SLPFPTFPNPLQASTEPWAGFCHFPPNSRSTFNQFFHFWLESSQSLSTLILSSTAVGEVVVGYLPNYPMECILWLYHFAKAPSFWLLRWQLLPAVVVAGAARRTTPTRTMATIPPCKPVSS